MNLPESVTVMILARLPAGVITRLKSVCREWKSLLESSYFRDLYRTINQMNLSSPWSILYKRQSSNTVLEFVGERWGFKQSIGSCVLRFLDEMKTINGSILVTALAITDGLILLDVSTKLRPRTLCVADPVLRQWINILKAPYIYFAFKGTSLVTHMNNGDLLGYKVVWYGMSWGEVPCFQIYSSDSGNWIQHNVTKPHFFPLFPSSNPINLNGCLHWICRVNQVIYAYDFYAPTELFCVIDLPQHSAKSSFTSQRQDNLTISCGSLMYMNTDTGRLNQQIKIWRLKNYMSGSSKESWEFLWNLGPGHDLCVECVPVAMHPFDKEVLYLVTRFQKHAYQYIVIGNLRTN